MIHPITPENPVCFGVACHQHRDCMRYQRVDGAPATAVRIDSCTEDGGTTFPRFEPARQWRIDNDGTATLHGVSVSPQCIPRWVG